MVCGNLLQAMIISWIIHLSPNSTWSPQHAHWMGFLIWSSFWHTVGSTPMHHYFHALVRKEKFFVTLTASAMTQYIVTKQQSFRNHQQPMMLQISGVHNCSNSTQKSTSAMFVFRLTCILQVIKNLFPKTSIHFHILSTGALLLHSLMAGLEEYNPSTTFAMGWKCWWAKLSVSYGVRPGVLIM